MADKESSFGGVLVAGAVAASLIAGAIAAVIQADAGQPRAIDGGPVHRVELAAENTQSFSEALINSGFPTGPVSLMEGRSVCRDMLGTVQDTLTPKYGTERAFDFVGIAHQHLCKITKVDGTPVQ